MKILSKKLLRDISFLRWQIMTMALLVACGIAVLVASWSAYVSLKIAKEKYYETFNFSDLFVDLVRAPNTSLLKISHLVGVQNVEGRIVQDALVDLPHQVEPALGRIISYSPLSQINKIYLRQGRLPEKSALPEVLLHESFAKAQKLRSGDTFDITIKGQKNRVQVVGIGISPEYVYALSPVAPFPDDLHFGVMWMEAEELARLSNMQGAINNVVIQTSSNVNLEELKNEIDIIVKPFGTLGTYDRKKQISDIFITDEIRQQRSMSYVVPSIFIVVASFILHTVISRLISLHRTQIAALKSLGYQSFDLVIYYWQLVTFILLLGILPAMAMAYGIGQWYAVLYERYFRFPHIDFTLSIQAVSIGVCAGLFPGWLASMISLTQVFALNPAEAMRPPSPSKFTRTIFEKWNLIRPKDLHTKMILRNIFARPWRSFLSVMGIAAATAILINGSFWSDIIDFMIQRQFYESNREDLDILFQHPRRLESLAELRRIPGVLLVESARTVPVRIQHRNVSKETALIAQKGLSMQKRILDRSGKELYPRPGQVLLSDYFAKKYNFKPGDILTLQLADKSLPDFQVTVGGFVDDVVGSSIYATPDDTHRWLQEMPSINSAYLKIDPSKSTEIYIKLKEFPEVLSVSVKKLLYQSFTATLSGMILTFTAILVAFAIMICGAVLFNMARINLSEKAWELASLKILGFDTSEVFRVLFLEMGFQLLVALIPGLGLGYFLSFLSTLWIHTDAFSFPLVIDISTYALAVVIVILTYTVAGWFLYHKVRALSMTEALKARE